jgi:hypothetical protein
MPRPEKLTVKCKECGRANIFGQPHAYHAGFSDQGFLYSDSGHFTLTWSDHDPVISRFFPPGSRWDRDKDLRRRFEDALKPAPDGGRWRAENPARCIHCSAPISGSMLQTTYYLLYPGSIVTQEPNWAMRLREYLSEGA